MAQSSHLRIFLEATEHNFAFTRKFIVAVEPKRGQKIFLYITPRR